MLLFSSRSVRTWNSSSAPRRPSSMYPSSSIYADVRIDRPMPTPQLCRGLPFLGSDWRDDLAFFVVGPLLVSA